VRPPHGILHSFGDLLRDVAMATNESCKIGVFRGTKFSSSRRYSEMDWNIQMPVGSLEVH